MNTSLSPVSSQTVSQKLVIFVKAPRPGFVKTRLVPKLGPEGAARAYRLLVGVLLGNLRGITPVELRYAPDQGLKEIEPWIMPGWSAAPQRGGHLGIRLQAAIRSSSLQGYRRILLIGSDCPEIQRQDVIEAWEALREHDVVLGPAKDGGYWLIGVTRLHPVLFTGISWSSNNVFQETVDRAVRANLKVHRLRKLTDIDTYYDWLEFQKRVPGGTA